MEILGMPSTSKHSRWSDLDEQRLLACKKTSLGSGSLVSSQAGLGPQDARAGPWYSAESSKLPPTGGQAAAQALCGYLSLGIRRDECLKRTPLVLLFASPSAGAVVVEGSSVKVRIIGNQTHRWITTKENRVLMSKGDMRRNVLY